MAIEKYYEVSVSIQYEEEENEEGKAPERWFDSSIYRLTKKAGSEKVDMDSLRPNLAQQSLTEVTEEMVEVLMEAKKALEEKSQNLINEIVTKSVVK